MQSVSSPWPTYAYKALKHIADARIIYTPKSLTHTDAYPSSPVPNKKSFGCNNLFKYIKIRIIKLQRFKLVSAILYGTKWLPKSPVLPQSSQKSK